MKVTANIATYPPRLNSLRNTYESIYDQFDFIRIYFNEYDQFPHLEDPDKKLIRIGGPNLTDNGKFVGLQHLTGPEYYFTCDDDLVYPSDYVQKTIEAIKTFGCIVTYHGRKLKGLNRSYYQGHEAYHCLRDVHGNHKIDVCGTGVTAFSTEYFCPEKLSEHSYHKMSDLIFSYEASIQDKTIGLIEHKAGWIKHTENQETIFESESKGKQEKQIHLSNLIYERNYNKHPFQH